VKRAQQEDGPVVLHFCRDGQGGDCEENGISSKHFPAPPFLSVPFWVTEHIVDFSKVPGFQDSQKDFIVEDPRYRERMGGMLTGPCTEGYMQNMWFNDAVARRVGLKIKEREMTFDDLLGYAEGCTGTTRTANHRFHSSS